LRLSIRSPEGNWGPALRVCWNDRPDRSGGLLRQSAAKCSQQAWIDMDHNRSAAAKVGICHLSAMIIWNTFPKLGQCAQDPPKSAR
jgi:hypothetical protein